MGYVTYEITLTLPGGKPASGAMIVATDLNAFLSSSKIHEGTTNKDGYFKWDTMATGLNNDTYRFRAQKDHEGILYIAEWTDRVNPSHQKYSKEIEMRTQFFEELNKIEIPQSAIKGLQNEGHIEILSLMNELNICISQKLPNASISLTTKILEGLIQIYLRKEGKWEDNMSEYPYGKLVDTWKQKDSKIEGIYDQLKGLNLFRKTAVHFKDVDTTIDEARLGNSLMIKVLKLLFPTGSQEQI